MVLAVDIGNTNIVLGLYEEKKLILQFRLRSDPLMTADEYAVSIIYLFDKKGISVNNITGVIIGSVVPVLQGTISRMVLKYININPIIVCSGIKSGVAIRVENQRELGADRIANAVGAINKFGFPCIVIDFGTATTFDVVNENGEYIGGIICPGVAMAAAGLHANTAKLPEINIKKPSSVVGRNTVNSMQSGVYYGYIGLINGLIEKIISEVFPSCQNLHLISTGGLGKIFVNELKYNVFYEPSLTLDGLRIMYEKNSV